MTIRKIISLIICLAICMSICANFSLAKAADATLDLLTFTLIDEGKHYSVSAKDKTISGEVVIPATYEGLPVTQLAAEGFRECVNITTVTLPDSIIRIGMASFHGATGLTEINLPFGLRYIGSNAFTGCKSLKAITIPNSVTHIGKATFNISGLESIVIPDSVVYKDIKNTAGTTPFDAEGMFGGCSDLKSITLPSNMTVIGERAFSSCESLESITIPETVTTIERRAFGNCPKLKYLYIPDSVEAIELEALDPVTSLHGISLPGDITFIKDYTYGKTAWRFVALHIYFRGTSSQFEAALSTMEEHKYDDCYFRYETVHYDCDGTETFELVNDDATDCLTYGGKTYNCSICGDIVFEQGRDYGPHIYAEDGTCTMCGLNKTNSADYLTFERAINEDGTEADYYIVSKCDTEASGAIIIPGEYNSLPVKVIGKSAFAGCNKITSIIISEGIEAIKTLAFNGAIGLKAVTIPSTLKSIEGRNVFPRGLDGVYIDDLSAWCNIDFETSTCNPISMSNNLYLYGMLIEDLVIPEDVTVIKQIAFQHLDSIKSVTFNNGIEEIGQYAFSYCQNLTEINIPDVPVKIRQSAFDRCAYYNDTNNWENNLLYIDNHLIESKDNSTELTIKDGTVTIADYAFYNMTDSANTSLETLNLPDSLVRIGDYSFYGAFNLNKINFGSGLKYIGNYAFYGTSMLGEVIFNEGLEYIGGYAFAYSELYLLHLPSTLKEFNPTSFFCTEWLEVLTCAEDNPYFIAEDNVLFTKDKHTLLLSSYKPGNGVSNYYVPAETKVIEDYAFCLHPSTVEIKLHDNIERIGEEAFADTYNTTKIDKNYVGKYLVCAEDTDFVVKDGTLGIADDALRGATNLTIPETVRFIGDSLEDVEAINLETIGSWLNMNLQHPDAEENLKNIQLKLNGVPFNELTSLQIPDGVTTIKDYHFGDCSGLKKLYIPSTVTEIDKNAFYNYNQDLVIYALSGSIGYYYAITNDIIIHDLYVEGIPGTGTTIDHINRLIYTPMFNADNISDIVKTAPNKESVALGSDYVNGKHLWGTGSTVTVYGNLGRENFTLVVTGDVNGDSVCDVLDLTATDLAVNEHTELSGCYALAADTNSDNEITIEDYSAMINTVLAS